MKATGIVRRVDDLGRIVIPKEVRRTIGIFDGTPMELFVEDKKVIFRKYNAADSLRSPLSGLEHAFSDCRSDLDKESVEKIEKCIMDLKKALEVKL